MLVLGWELCFATQTLKVVQYVRIYHLFLCHNYFNLSQYYPYILTVPRLQPPTSGLWDPNTINLTTRSIFTPHSWAFPFLSWNNTQRYSLGCQQHALN